MYISENRPGLKKLEEFLLPTASTLHRDGKVFKIGSSLKLQLLSASTLTGVSLPTLSAVPVAKNIG